MTPRTPPSSGLAAASPAAAGTPSVGGGSPPLPDNPFARTPPAAPGAAPVGAVTPPVVIVVPAALTPQEKAKRDMVDIGLKVALQKLEGDEFKDRTKKVDEMRGLVQSAEEQYKEAQATANKIKEKLSQAFAEVKRCRVESEMAEEFKMLSLQGLHAKRDDFARVKESFIRDVKARYE